MNEHLNELRIQSGISRLQDDEWRLIVINKEGHVIDPLIGLEKFAELIVKECVDFLKDTLDDHFAAEQLEEHFGVE